MRHLYKLCIIVGLLVALANCNGSTTSLDEARNTADREIKKKFNVKQTGKLIVSVDDLGDSWRFNYSGGPNAAGGPLIVVVDKKSRKVREVYGWQ
jgi:ribosomal protein S6E (S10)